MAQPSSSSNKITMNEARELLRQHDASMPDYDRIWREIEQEERRVREELTNARPGDPILGPVEAAVPKPPPMRKAPPMQSTAQPVRSPQYKAPPKQLSMAKASQPSSSSNTVPPAAPLTLPFEELACFCVTKRVTVHALPRSSKSQALGAIAVLCLAPARRARRRLALKGWGDDVSFFDASVKSNVEAADGLRLITMEAPEEVSKPYQRAGQFVQAKEEEDSKASFYAISSAPGGDLEFLIKEADSNDWITATKGGDLVKLSPAMGKGFNTDCQAWKDAGVSQVSLFATGSGISPMRALIESKALSGKVCRLYYGAREEGKLAYANRFDKWRQSGIEIIPVLSKGDDSWQGRRGYVQEVMKEDEDRREGFVLSAKHGAVLCGQKDMVTAVRAIYAELGVPEERTLLNF
eukprot:s71_g10.t2